jgi:hypothetical protein
MNVATAARSMTSVYTRRPPNWSVQMPRATRLIAPLKIGVPIRRPNCVSLRPSSLAIRTPMMENIVHTAKHTAKAIVDIQRARPCSPGSISVLSSIGTISL